MLLSRGRELGLMELTHQLTGVKQVRLSTSRVHNSSGKYRFDSHGQRSLALSFGGPLRSKSGGVLRRTAR